MSSPREPKRRDLTRDKVIEAALKAMKHDGADKLTMRGIADECGTTAMALYHHVSNKGDLINLAIDSLFFRVANSPRRGDTWREQVANLLIDIRASLLEVPGAGETFVRQAVLGPGTALTTEEMFRLLNEGGLEGAAAAEAADAMTMLTIGSIANELTRPHRVRDQLATFLPDDAMPNLSANIEVYSDRDGTARFITAFNWLLDGIDPAVERLHSSPR